MAGQASVFINQKGAFLWLMGLTIVFEIIAHLKMWRALEAEEHGAIGSSRLTAEEWCLASSDPASPRCLEAELFRSWQRSTPAWPLAVGDVGLEGTVQDMAARAPNATGSGAVAMEQVSPLGSPLQKIFGLTTQPTTSSSPSRVASAAQGKVTADAHAWSPMTSWAKGLVELQKSLEERFNALPSERLRQAQRRAAEFDRLAEQVSSSLEHSSGDTQWGKDLEALQRRLEEQHASLPSQQTLESKLDREAAKITESLQASTGSRWGEGVEKLQGELEARQAALPSQRRAVEAAKAAEPTLMDQINAVHKELCLEPHHRDLATCVDFLAGLAASHEASLDAHRLERSRATAGGKKTAGEELEAHKAELHADLARIAAERKTWEQQFQGKVQDIYADFCSTRGGVWCTTPAPAVAASPSDRHAAKVAMRENITREAKERAAALDAKLAKMAEDRKEWERALLEHYGVVSAAGPHEAGEAASTTSLVDVWPGVANLRWSKVAAWASSGSQLRGREHARVSSGDLESAKWVGALPKVACVAAVPLGHGAKSQVKYVIEGFNKQTYEGPKQLVLVYHHEDEEAADVMRMYADGFYIKAVAARGPREDYPSATALRFGAWSADADAIAQWDFDEQQDPQRLALQIRALAFVSKPACLLAASSAAPTAAESERAAFVDSSLLGETAWMREHWHPALKEQKAVLAGAQAHNIVALALKVPAGAVRPAGERLQAMRSNMDRHFEGLVEMLEVNATGRDAPVTSSAA